MFSICVKTQLNEDSFTPIKDIHTKLIHLQTILAIRHGRNWCLLSLLCPIPLEKKHIPLAIFLSFNASPNSKVPSIILQMNTLARCINPEYLKWLHHMKPSGNGLMKTHRYLYNPFIYPLMFVNQVVIIIFCWYHIVNMLFLTNPINLLTSPI